MELAQKMLEHLIDALNDIASGATASIDEYAKANHVIAQNLVVAGGA
jgi:hypothetical protein